ncbi:SOS-response transcriptional repressor, LexA [Catenulispora acidiphila DSM 44928]|jgi:repressor LexA|uniref:LexA repressor n=1 Tax=Catenulispora acidiphila (strain DSM 44928 / JCM 14897 / NBRC 102108 / NRRL B-24433 / ID139908) TaxID=479433 RepID=C7QD25_CATAD|nr:transcriptional repressor LexA [Catenulispora acidiphila]ACU70735.1 SOS-response transcriptional repressor, LexA [Catenulispora acidiphila DSM 44928]
MAVRSTTPTDNREAAHDGHVPSPRLTERQTAVLNVIRDSVRRRGYPPSMREIGEAVGLQSTSSVRHQLVTLESKGFLHRDANRPRAYIVRGAENAGRAANGSEPEPAYVPLVGRIAAGGPILAEERVEELIPIPKQMVGEGEFFALRVVGDSMIEAAICDGDVVVIRQQKQAENGEFVAAMIDGEATVKELKKEANAVWLMPRNAAYEPIPGNDAVILGRVVTVLRRL